MISLNGIKTYPVNHANPVDPDKSGSTTCQIIFFRLSPITKAG